MSDCQVPMVTYKKPPITVREILNEYLKKHGYDGLSGRECGCRLDDLMPCYEPSPDCEPGYLIECEECGETDGPNWCVSSDPGYKPCEAGNDDI